MHHNDGIIIAGHQPNFFPWFGYFEKMLNSDIFVFSDDVQYPKQCYVNRVEIPINSQPHQFILPVKKGNDKRIADKQYLKDKKSLSKMIMTIRFNTGGLNYFSDVENILSEFERVYWDYETISELNIHLLEYISRILDIKTKTIRGTELGLEKYHSNERLIKRCELLGSSVYLCGQGADSYQDEGMLRNAGINLKKIDYGIGRALLGEDLRYSILHGIAKIGIEKIIYSVKQYQAENPGNMTES